MKQVGIYSGSFNPIHVGHLIIANRMLQEEGVDEVWFVVSPQNPLKDAAYALSGRERYEAAVAAVKRHPEIRVWVDDIELGMEPPQYTIRTLDALHQREPENEFTLVIGADNLESFPRWRDYGRILREYGVAVFPRKGYHRGYLKARLMREDPAYRIELLPAPRIDISSTDIRDGLEAGRDMSRWLM